jgi:hypothetical protein
MDIQTSNRKHPLFHITLLCPFFKIHVQQRLREDTSETWSKHFHRDRKRFELKRNAVNNERHPAAHHPEN